MIVLLGEQGAGKSSVAKCLSAKYKRIATCTTRPKRDDEIHGVDYLFCSNESFREKIDNNDFIEWQVYKNDWYYGTLKSTCLEDDSVIVLTPQGLEKLKQYNRETGNKLNIVSFYIKVDDSSRKEKLYQTRQDHHEIERRWAKDIEDFNDIYEQVDYVISNARYNSSIFQIANKIDSIYTQYIVNKK